MPSDWIKMRTDLYRDPKVCAMADSLLEERGSLARYVDHNQQCAMSVTRNVTRNAVVGALLSVWGVMRHRGKRIGDDLLLRGMTLLVVDDVADLPGFGEAMASVDWAIESDEGVVFPNFFEDHNVEPYAGNKTKAAERQARYRARRASQVTSPVMPLRDVTRDVTLRPREEERKEENNNQKKEQEPPLPPKGKVRKPKSMTIHPVPERFEEFWSLYPKKEDKIGALKKFASLSAEDVSDLMATLPNHVRHWTLHTQPQYVPQPTKWLNGRRWEDVLTTPTQAPAKQARQSAVFEVLANDHRYAQTAARMVDERDPPRLPSAHAVLAGLSTPAGNDSDDAGSLDRCLVGGWIE